MTPWQYFAVYLVDSSLQEKIDVLNVYGKDGWELVAVVRSSDEVSVMNTYYFRRPLEAKPKGKRKSRAGGSSA